MVTPENTMVKLKLLGVINMTTFYIIVIVIVLLVATYYSMK
jgi:hypothetical protein